MEDSSCVEAAVAAAPASRRMELEWLASYDQSQTCLSRDQATAVQARTPFWHVFDEARRTEHVYRAVGVWLQQYGTRFHVDDKLYLHFQTLRKLVRAVFNARPGVKKTVQQGLSGLATRLKQRPRSPVELFRQNNASGKLRTTLTAAAAQHPHAQTAPAAPAGAAASAIFTAYLITATAYAVARISAFVDALGEGLWPSERWYSAAVLAAELLSIAALTFHSLPISLLITPLHGVDAEAQIRASASGELRRGYTVRVLILCNGETDKAADRARRTVLSVRNSVLPDGCELKVYLVGEEDAGSKKIESVGDVAAELGADVTCITAPSQYGNTQVHTSHAEMLLNFALPVIYPEARAGAPGNSICAGELVSAVASGDTWPPSYIATLVREIDSSDDVGAAVCSQACGDTDSACCDIFDARGTAHGMDAWVGAAPVADGGMLIRARALQDAGWVPARALTENWELSMLLRGSSWKSLYVPECSMVREAPGDVAAALDAHYRQSCGRFQTFWSWQSPLLQRDLSLLHRLVHAGLCLQSFASGLWVAVFTLVPIVHLIAGAFPVHFSEAVVATMAAHYLLRAALLLRARSLHHLYTLWLSRVAASIFAWGDLRAACLTPIKAATNHMASLITGPRTSPRLHPRASPMHTPSPAVLRWPLAIVLLSLAAAMSGCMHLYVVADPVAAVSLCLVAINAAPPLLLLARRRSGRGPAFKHVCAVAMAASAAASAAAFGFLPLLFPRNVDFARAGRLSLRFLQAERSGRLPANHPVPWREDSGLQYSDVNATFVNVTRGVVTDKTDFFFKSVDLSGGFYTEGEAGPVKLTWNVAVTTSMLAWAMLEYPGFWGESPELKQEATALLLHGALYMQEVYVVTPLRDPFDPTRLDSSRNDQLVYVVGNVQRERQQWRRPEDITAFRGFDSDIGVMPLDESPSDLAGQVVAAITAGALALRQYEVIDRSVASAMVDKAHRLFQSALVSPGLYMDGFNGTAASEGIEELYPSATFADDLFWASTWMFRAASSGFRTFNTTYYQQAMSVTMTLSYGDLDIPGVSWEYMNNLAVTHAATLTADVRYHLATQSFLWDWLCDDELVQYTRNGRAYFPGTPHLGSTAGAAAMAALYVHSTRGSENLEGDLAMTRGLQCFAGEQARYLLGGQVSSVFPNKPFMVGYNNRTFTRTWHRGASCPAPGAGACTVQFAISDDPDVNSITGALLWNPTLDDLPDDARGRNATVVSLENNFAVPLLFAAVHTQSAQHTRCLNVRGTALLHSRVCRRGRPYKFRLGPLEDARRVEPEFEGLYKPTENPADRIPPPPPPPPVERPLVTNLSPE